MKSKLYCILLLFFTINTFMYAHKSNEIDWLQNNRPPWLISSGIYKNEGYGDKIREYITTNFLSEYKNRLIPINPSRALKIVKENNSNLCYGPIFKLKDTQDNFYYSKPIYVLPQGRIIVTNDTYNKLGKVGKISMLDLIQNEDYTFGTIKGIHFYPFDVTQFKNQKNVITLSSSSPIVNLLQMMKKNRIDWIYDYAVFIKWETFLNKNFEKTFKTIQVKETKNLPKSIAYIGCSKNEFGKKIIDKINISLNQNAILEMRSYVRRWQLDESVTSSFDDLNKELFGY